VKNNTAMIKMQIIQVPPGHEKALNTKFIKNSNSWSFGFPDILKLLLEP
jgi:hypothetical protein